MKDTASVQNWLLSNNRTPPIVGKGATQLLWSDRHAYEVLEVSPDLKRVVIQRYDAKRIDDKNYYGEDQLYAYTDLQGPKIELVFRNGAYREIVKTRSLKLEAIKACHVFHDKRLKNEEAFREYQYQDSDYTIKTSYPKMNIVFGYAQEYRDPHF